MKKFYLAIFLFISIVSVGVSQKTLSDYTYVIVPEQYSFLKEKNEYQLNSLTKFLFNKYGFNAYFDIEVPVDVRRCDGLWADIIGSPGFVYTKIVVVLKDCYGAEVYRSEEGKSKEKNFKNAYYEAMRRAFESLEVLGVKQKKASNYSDKADSNSINVNRTNNGSIKHTAIESEELSDIKNLPTSKYTTFSNEGSIYLLKKTKDGFNFYKESKSNDDDLLFVGTLSLKIENIEFVDNEQNKYPAYFNDSNSFIVKKNGKSIVYKLEN